MGHEGRQKGEGNTKKKEKKEKRRKGKAYSNVEGENAADRGRYATLGRPNAYHLGRFPETCCKFYCQARPADGGAKRLCCRYRSCGTWY